MTNDNNNKSWLASVRAGYRRHPILITLASIILISIVLGWLTFVFLDFWTDHGETTVVPDVRSMTYDKAMAELEHSDLKIQIGDSVYDEKIAPGTVLEMWPRAGAVVKPGRDVFVTITSFQPKKVLISQELTGISSRQVLSYLESLGINNVRLVNVPSPYPDLVLGAKYNGRSVSPGMHIPVNATITLEVGTQQTEIPVEPPVVETTTVDDDNSVYPYPVTSDEETSATAPTPPVTQPEQPTPQPDEQPDDPQYYD